MRNLIFSAVEDAFRPYLVRVLAQNPEAQHAHLQSQFAAHMAFLADFCLAGYGGAGLLTTDFICGLHRAMFPPDYRQEVITRDGQKIWMLPGEYKSISNNVCESYLQPGKTVVFLAPEQVSSAMTQAVNTLNVALLAANDARQKLDAILWFTLDFLSVHPFVDANGRVACILADLLAIREGLPPFYFHSIKTKDQPELYRAVQLAQRNRDLAPIREVLALLGERAPR